MSNRNPINPGSSVPQASDQNQPMDLAQKPNRLSEVTSVLKGGTTLVQFGNTQLIATSAPTLITNKTGMRNENLPSGTHISRQPGQGALNLVNPGAVPSGAVSVSAKSISQTSVSSASSTSLLPSTGYHIPRGAAVVANMTASRSQNISSIIRTTSQVIGTPNASTVTTRASIISQRMVPISNSNWIRSTTPTAIVTSKGTSTQFSSRATITPGRPPQTAGLTANTYQTGPLKAGSLRPHGSPSVRVGTSAEILRPHTPKGIQITQPTSHSPKLLGSPGTGVTKLGTTAFVTPGSNVGASSMYTPNSTLVTSLASSGTTITPHPGNRIHPPNAVRLTTSSIPSPSVSQTHTSPLGGICLTPSSTGTILTHHPSNLNRVHSSDHHVKAPLVRGSHSIPKGGTTSLPAGTHISFSGPKVIAQTSPGSPLALAQITNVTGQKGPGGSAVSPQPSGIASVPFQTRQGSSLARGGTGPTISMAKIIPQGKVGIGHVSAHSVGNSMDGVTPHTNLVLQRGSNTVGPSVQSEKTLVTQYSIATPYYFESTTQSNLPVNASIVPSTQYMSSGGVTPGGLRIGGGVSVTTPDSNSHPGVPVPLLKPNSSPRPSILRKRTDNESVPSKAAKNLSAALNIPMASPPSPVRPDSRGNGNVSSGSTTLSANSSPGMQINEEDSNNGGSKTPKSESLCDDSSLVNGPLPCVINVPLSSRSTNANVASFIEAAVASSMAEKGEAQMYSIPDGVSPRKKPRKQTLMGNELMESSSNEELFEHPLVKKVKREKEIVIPVKKTRSSESDEDRENSREIPPPKPPPPDRRAASSPSPPPEPILKKPQMSLINSYRQQWKSRHNHFAKHSDVRPKEEKKRTVNEIANQKMAMQRVNGWKVVHLSGQVEDLVSCETDINRRLQSLLNGIEKRQQSRKPYKDFDKDVNRLSELFKANMQRSVIIRDQMSEAKTQMNKIFNHKDNIVNILSKYGNKRTLRKKEKISH